MFPPLRQLYLGNRIRLEMSQEREMAEHRLHEIC
jgi:hypothetical protein